MKQVWLSVCWLVCWVSCQKQGGAAPDGLIRVAEMAAIQRDVHLAESSIMSYRSNERDSMATLFYQHIFRIHGTSEEEYYPSLEYYSQHPDLLEKIYAMTKTELEKLEQAK